jgi:putative endonuclease
VTASAAADASAGGATASAGDTRRAQLRRDLARGRAARGRRAEQLALEHILALGWTVLGQNLRVGPLEIDLLALEGDCVVVVEVRSRGPGSWLGPLASVGRDKRQHLRRAGEALWRARFQADAMVTRMRFDVIAVRLDGPEPALEHVRAAL